MPAHATSIEFRDVCFSYEPGRPILTNVHLKVRHGETVALVGKARAAVEKVAGGLEAWSGWDVRDGTVPGLGGGQGQLADDALVRAITGALRKSGAVVCDIANQLSALGARLAVDNCGAGYAALARLPRLPFCELKIDHSNVTGCDRDLVNAGICETIVELAHEHGIAAYPEYVITSIGRPAGLDQGVATAPQVAAAGKAVMQTS